MIYLSCPNCKATRNPPFHIRGQFCDCGWWRDRSPEPPAQPAGDAAYPVPSRNPQPPAADSREVGDERGESE